MKTILAAAVLTAVTFSASACGGDDSAEVDAAASKAIANSIVKQRSEGGPGALLSMQRAQAACIGNGLVDKIGVDGLRKSGLLTEDNKVKGSIIGATLSASDARTATDVLFGCADVEAMVEKALARDGNISPTMRPCVNKVVDDKSLRSMFTDYFQGDKNAPQKLVRPMMRCIGGNAG